MEEMNRNKLLKIFRFVERWRRGIQTRQEENVVAARSTPMKRKKREHEDTCQASPLLRRNMNL